MGWNLDPIWIDTFFFYNGRKITVSNIQHPFGKLSLLFRISCHDSHVDMKTKNRNMLPKMRSKQQSTDNVFSSPLGNNRKNLLKIPTKDHGFPTKNFISCLCVIQLHLMTQGAINSFESLAMHHQCLIPNDQINFTHQLSHFHLLCDVANLLIVQINRNLESKQERRLGNASGPRLGNESGDPHHNGSYSSPNWFLLNRNKILNIQL